MNRIRRELDPLGFTAQEKLELAARLERVAEQEGTRTKETSHRRGKLSRGMMVGLAAACLVTVGALAAVFSPGLRSYLDASTPGAQETLEQGIYQLDRSLTHNGWTVELAECVGDDNGVYIWIDVTAPEGTVLAEPEHGDIGAFCYVELPEGTTGACGELLMALPDGHPTDNRISFCLDNAPVQGDLRGETVTITLDPIVDCWYTDPGTDQAQFHEGSELTEAIRDHIWVFEDVSLDYPDQTIRLTPNVEVPYLDGTATLTKIELSPLNARIRIEGGSCEGHHRLFQDQVPVRAASPTPEQDDFPITAEPFEVPSSWLDGSDCIQALGVELHMKDGSVYNFHEDISTRQSGSSCQDGRNPYYEGELYVEGLFQYADQNSNLVPDQIIDPAQVEYVMVCGTKIPLES